MRAGLVVVGLSLISVPAGAAGPDLIVDPDLLANSWEIATRTFAPTDCEVVNECIVPGTRTILRFGTRLANIGDQDIALGDPATNPIFHYNSCWGIHIYDYHSHITLIAPGGHVVSETWKPGQCLYDQARYLDEPWVPGSPTYTCTNQGLSRGWYDTYSQYFECQWVDVTDVMDGAYTLRVEANPLDVLPDVDSDNDFEEIPVFVGDPGGVSHRPDGLVLPGTPVSAARIGSSVEVSYDTTVCPASEYNLYYGITNPPSSYTYDGAYCNLGTDGQELLPLPDPAPGQLLWFVIAGADGSTEGGHGFSSPVVERPLNGIGWCSVSDAQSMLSCSP